MNEYNWNNWGTHVTGWIRVWFNLLFANVILVIFNLIPAYPLDRVRLLKASLDFKYERRKTTSIAAGIRQFLAIFWVMLQHLAGVYRCVHLPGAGAEAVHESTKSALSSQIIKDVLMQQFIWLFPEDTLGKVVQLLLNSQEQEYLVKKIIG